MTRLWPAMVLLSKSSGIYSANTRSLPQVYRTCLYLLTRASHDNHHFNFAELTIDLLQCISVCCSENGNRI